MRPNGVLVFSKLQAQVVFKVYGRIKAKSDSAGDPMPFVRDLDAGEERVFALARLAKMRLSMSSVFSVAQKHFLLTLS